MVVLIMVVVDLLVLIVFTAVVGGLNLSLVERVTHRENPQDVEGVSRSSYGGLQVASYSQVEGLYRLHASSCTQSSFPDYYCDLALCQL